MSQCAEGSEDFVCLKFCVSDDSENNLDGGGEGYIGDLITFFEYEHFSCKSYSTTNLFPSRRSLLFGVSSQREVRISGTLRV